MRSKNPIRTPPPQILQSSPRKATISSAIGVLMFISFTLLKYFFPELAETPVVLPILFLISVIFLIYGIYYFSDTLDAQKMLLYGALGLIGGSVILYFYILFHPPVLLELGIIIIVLSLFLLLHGILMLFRKNTNKSPIGLIESESFY